MHTHTHIHTPTHTLKVAASKACVFWAHTRTHNTHNAHTHTHTHMHTYKHAHNYAHIHTYTHIHKHTHTLKIAPSKDCAFWAHKYTHNAHNTHIHTRPHTHICTHTHTHTITNAYEHTHIHTPTHTLKVAASKACAFWALTRTHNTHNTHTHTHTQKHIHTCTQLRTHTHIHTPTQIYTHLKSSSIQGLCVLNRHLYPPFAAYSISLSVWDMTHSYVWHDSFTRRTCALPSYVYLYTYIVRLIPSAYPCGTWLIYEMHKCDMTPSHEWPAPSLHMYIFTHI